MTELKFNEVVRLLADRQEPRDMPLSEAIRTVVDMPDLRDRMKVAILRDGGKPIDTWEEIEAIYKRPDFPK